MSPVRTGPEWWVPDLDGKEVMITRTPNGLSYNVKSLGSPAAFVLPKRKLTPVWLTAIASFLEERYRAVACSPVESGAWIDETGLSIKGELMEFRAPFVGKQRLPELFDFLATVAHALEEKAVYAKYGEESFLLEL